MEDKTFGSITVYDKLFVPLVRGILELTIDKIERLGDQRIRIRYYYANAVVVKISATTIEVDRSILCVNKAKAEKIRETLIMEEFEKLSQAASSANSKLKEFTLKYLIPNGRQVNTLNK